MWDWSIGLPIVERTVYPCDSKIIKAEEREVIIMIVHVNERLVSYLLLILAILLFLMMIYPLMR